MCISRKFLALWVIIAHNISHYWGVHTYFIWNHDVTEEKCDLVASQVFDRYSIFFFSKFVLWFCKDIVKEWYVMGPIIEVIKFVIEQKNKAMQVLHPWKYKGYTNAEIFFYIFLKGFREWMENWWSQYLKISTLCI